MKKLLTVSIFATGVLLASQVQAFSQTALVSGTFSKSFLVSVVTDPGTSDQDLWFRFKVTAIANDFQSLSYSISESGNTAALFSGSISPTGGLYSWTFFDKANSVQDFSSRHNYDLIISGNTKSAGNKAFTLNYNSFVASVPEPESYALFLAGLGLMGFMARRRQAGVSA
jgi:hypothetical protein